MAVLLQQTMPAGVTVGMLDAVTDEMDVRGDPPKGMIVHVHYEQDGQTQVVDVWESRDAYDTFVAERLRPAMEKVASQAGAPAPTDQMAQTLRVIEVHSLVRGA